MADRTPQERATALVEDMPEITDPARVAELIQKISHQIVDAEILEKRKWSRKK